MDESSREAVWRLLAERFPERFAASASENARGFLAAITTGDLETVRRMIQRDPDLLFVIDEHYGSPVRAATAKHRQIADFLAHIELQRLREGSVPKRNLYGAIHDLGEAAHSTTGYAGSDTLRAEAEPVVTAFLTHHDGRIRGIAVSVLTLHWDMGRHRDELIDLLRHDPEDQVRSWAAAGLGFVFRESHDAVVSRALIQRIRDNAEDTHLRQTAYRALRELWFHRTGEQSLAELRGEIQRGKEWDKDYAAARSGEEQEGVSWIWGQDRLWEIDWEFVDRIEGMNRGENFGAGPSAGDPS